MMLADLDLTPLDQVDAHRHISPTPEPSTYGFILVLTCLILVLGHALWRGKWRGRYRR
jgi:hypothetical protein